jgi:hypothetical protein
MKELQGWRDSSVSPCILVGLREVSLMQQGISELITKGFPASLTFQDKVIKLPFIGKNLTTSRKLLS